MIVSRRSRMDLVAARRICSMCSLTAASFSMKRSRAGDVGLGLVEVVVGDEVLHGVLREEVAHFSVGLRGERLVGRHDEGGDAEPRDDVRHRVGLARTRHAEQRLEHDAVLKPLGERLDGRGLIARRRKGLVKDEGRVGISDDLCHWKPRSGI